MPFETRDEVLSGLSQLLAFVVGKERAQTALAFGLAEAVGARLKEIEGPVPAGRLSELDQVKRFEAELNGLVEAAKTFSASSELQNGLLPEVEGVAGSAPP